MLHYARTHGLATPDPYSYTGLLTAVPYLQEEEIEDQPSPSEIQPPTERLHIDQETAQYIQECINPAPYSIAMPPSRFLYNDIDYPLETAASIYDRPVTMPRTLQEAFAGYALPEPDEGPVTVEDIASIWPNCPRLEEEQEMMDEMEVFLNPDDFLMPIVVELPELEVR